MACTSQASSKDKVVRTFLSEYCTPQEKWGEEDEITAHQEWQTEPQDMAEAHQGVKKHDARRRLGGLLERVGVIVPVFVVDLER
jgi:hypothetical protein